MNAFKFNKTMNIKLKTTVLFLTIVSAGLFTGCTKWDKLVSPHEGNIYMAQAYSDRAELQVFKIDSAQTFSFGASIAGFDGAPSDIHVTFEVDNSLIAGFNEEHAYLNYNFVPFPSDALDLKDLESTIRAGRSDSDPLSFSIMTTELDGTIDYCLPIKIKSVSQGNIDSTLSIAYFTVDSLYIRSRDVTGLGTLSVSKENNGGSGAGEGSPKVVDNDYTTKYLFSDFTSGQWIQLKMNEAIKLSAYTLTSGNDAPERDPKNWEFQGSKNGSTWVTLDERTDYSFPSRRQTHTFEFNHPDGETYTYYRILLNQINGSNLFQLTEWRLLEYY